MTVRRATVDDIPQIKELIEQNEDTLIQRDDTEIERNINFFFVKEVRKKIVGCCCLEIYSPKIAEIRSVAVNHNSRLKGYGKQLIKKAVEEGTRLKIKEIMVVTSNPKFFEKLSFSTCLNEKYALFWNRPVKKAKRA